MSPLNFDAEGNHLMILKRDRNFLINCMKWIKTFYNDILIKRLTFYLEIPFEFWSGHFIDLCLSIIVKEKRILI